jgi:protein TonB
MSKLGLILGVVGAVLVHVFILLFGGIFFMKHEAPVSTREVELVGGVEAEKEKDKDKEPEPEPDQDRIEEKVDAPPDAEEVVRNLQAAPVIANDAPALAEASLAAIEQALSGGGGGGGDEFGSSLNFASGGRIGGTGVAGAVGGEKLEEAFSMSEIDQKPRPVYQTAANYPSELRGKKLEGVVTVIFIVDANGRVSSPRVEKSSHPAFEKPALDSVKQWKFEAGVKGGERVATRMRVPVRFQPK